MFTLSGLRQALRILLLRYMEIGCQESALGALEMDSWLLIDCALRTTAILLEATDTGHRLVARGEARTTLDPEGDITLGVYAAVRQLEEGTGRVLLKPENDPGLISPRNAQGNGVDQVLVTSSVGGGLQMMVAGLVRILTAESAERAALGAGANVLDVIAIDDGRLPFERIERMRQLRPDIFLFGGGVDNGNQGDVQEFAREIAQADLSDMPIVYAGNTAARQAVIELLGADYEVHMVDNLRPVLEKEVLEPTREKLHDLFMRHVVSQAPGFAKLSSWTDRSIMPSTGAVSKLMETVAERSQQNVLGVIVGDSTTDVFSVFDGRFTRTVSADLGLGYSIANVAVKAGRANLMRWLAFTPGKDELMDHLRNKMLKPAGRPDNDSDLAIQQAAAREAMRMALAQHKRRATRLRGMHQERDIASIFEKFADTLVDMGQLNLIIASASVFAWADDQANAHVLMDALRPEGITRLAIDQFMSSPHLGILTSVDAEVGHKVFVQESLRHLGVAICPIGRAEAGTFSLSVSIATPGQVAVTHQVNAGALTFLTVAEGSEVVIQPNPTIDIGAGRGHRQTFVMGPNTCGLIIDTREKVQA